MCAYDNFSHVLGCGHILLELKSFKQTVATQFFNSVVQKNKNNIIIVSPIKIYVQIYKSENCDNVLKGLINT